TKKKMAPGTRMANQRAAPVWRNRRVVQNPLDNPTRTNVNPTFQKTIDCNVAVTDFWTFKSQARLKSQSRPTLTSASLSVTDSRIEPRRRCVETMKASSASNAATETNKSLVIQIRFRCKGCASKDEKVPRLNSCPKDAKPSNIIPKPRGQKTNSRTCAI